MLNDEEVKSSLRNVMIGWHNNEGMQSVTWCYINYKQYDISVWHFSHIN